MASFSVSPSSASVGVSYDFRNYLLYDRRGAVLSALFRCFPQAIEAPAVAPAPAIGIQLSSPESSIQVGHGTIWVSTMSGDLQIAQLIGIVSSTMESVKEVLEIKEWTHCIAQVSMSAQWEGQDLRQCLSQKLCQPAIGRFDSLGVEGAVAWQSFELRVPSILPLVERTIKFEAAQIVGETRPINVTVGDASIGVTLDGLATLLRNLEEYTLKNVADFLASLIIDKGESG